MDERIRIAGTEVVLLLVCLVLSHVGFDPLWLGMVVVVSNMVLVIQRWRRENYGGKA